MAKAPVIQKQAPAKAPLTTCPFTGQAVAFREIGKLKQVVIHGENYVMGPFATKEIAQFVFSTRNGVLPTFPISKISRVEEVVENDNPLEGLQGADDVASGKVAEMFNA